jgi:hypothetical protein
MAYVPPEFNAASFTCPHCEALAQMVWAQPLQGGDGSWHAARCQVRDCARVSWWHQLGGDPPAMKWPSATVGPIAHGDMPEEARDLYDEARDIAGRSPRAAAALLRVALQSIVDELRPGSDSLDKKIGGLVAAGLSPEVQRAMDALRIIGNNAVHPSEVRLHEDQSSLTALFQLLNVIIEQTVGRQRMIDAMYSALPDTARAAIERRDGST